MTTDVSDLAETLRSHGPTAGTHWDGSKHTVYHNCMCGVKCYPLLDGLDAATHLAEVALASVRCP